MSTFDQKKFLEALNKIRKQKIPNCSFCGGNNFTLPEEISPIILSKDLTSMQLGISMPAGMLVCSRCGHVEFFALGALGLLPKEGDDCGGE